VTQARKFRNTERSF